MVICPALKVAGAGNGITTGVNRDGLNHLHYEQPETKWSTTVESNLHERTDLIR